MLDMVIIIHVVSMITSFALMSSAVALGLLGKKSAVTLASRGTFMTIVGFISGVGLMIESPLTVKCAILTAYLAAVITLYYVGYGFGNVNKARFIRANS